MSGQMSIEPVEPAIGPKKSEVLGLVMLGFSHPGRWESGSKVPAKVREKAAAIALRAVEEMRAAVE